MRHPAILLTVAAISTISRPVQALEFGLSVYEESEYTTNSGRTERDEVEEWIHSPGVNLTTAHTGPNLDVSVDYRLTRRIYQQDLFEDENEASGAANLVWNALPQRLDFNVNHTRTQSSIRSISAATPDNRQETVNTSAGPSLRFNPRGSDELRFTYLWGERSAEETRNDATTHDSSVSYQLTMSNTSSLTFTGMLNQVQYDNPFAPDIEYTIGQLTWDRQLSSVNYSLMGGYTKAERTKDLDDVNGGIFSGNLTWQARPATIITFDAGRDIRDQSANLSSGRFVDDLDFAASSDLAEVFTNERASVSVNQQLNQRTSMDFAVFVDREDYEDVARDTDRQTYRLGINRRLTRQMDLSFSADLATEEFDDEGDEADTIRGNLTLTYDFGRRFNFSFGVSYEERDSDTDIASRTYDEWSAFFRIAYDAIQLTR